MAAQAMQKCACGARARVAGPRAEARTACLRDVAEDEPPAGESSASDLVRLLVALTRSLARRGLSAWLAN